MPYIDTYQPSGFNYVYDVWQDTDNARQRMVRDDVEVVLTLVLGERCGGGRRGQWECACRRTTQPSHLTTTLPAASSRQ